MELLRLEGEKYTYKAIQDQNGNWVGETEALERLVIDYFATLFSSDSSYVPYGVRGAFPRV